MEEKVKILKALGDETRIGILQQLLDGEQCACSIVPLTGKAQSTISQHLKLLVDSEVLKSRRVGTNIWYGIKNNKVKEIMKILDIKKINNNKKC